ncbi:ATPase family protein associated with various cellular activities (AAA) [Kineococcus xinjiangensis]|uniref:ATPase family protein associated with various cellular activities (AAA) n=1 Tax=Kineococcus xinjiangensis TaxID=512762 RepID=A0A2S6IU78_9ACTN|nr:ATP-binding protein [Kineococcus xinjiangensis]PPK97812.1 ATPase family protein associated with various cellular activities (AAA) [Kineococcus xinjiangensis]
MDPSQQAFVDIFRTFLEEVVQHARAGRAEGGPSLLQVVTKHLGQDPRRLPVLREEVLDFRAADVDIALDALAEEHGQQRLVGVSGGDQRFHQTFADLLDQTYHSFGTAAPDHVNLPTGPDSDRRVVAFGVRLLRFGGAPVAVLQRSAKPSHGQGAALEVITADEDVAAGLLARVRALAVERSVLRGQVLSFSGSPFDPSSGGVAFLRRPDVAAEDVVLPPGVLDRIVRHVVRVGDQRERLLAAGQHLKRGVLLYGPPGTGKTLTVRHLLSRTPGTTVVLLSGQALAHITTAAHVARAMQPTLIVLEDCDLVAEDRGHHPSGQPLLFELLEALDGLDGDADVAFLMTTNRADRLERALAQRPGRVDLAVEVPLPDVGARRQLLRLYARSLPLSEAALDAAAERAEGVTASFAKELLRRAVLDAAVAGHEVGDADLAAALEELLSDAEALTRSLLGSGAQQADGPDGDGFDGPWVDGNGFGGNGFEEDPPRR